ncbi:hypothetical protein D3C73_1405420 [compost metagenome]
MVLDRRRNDMTSAILPGLCRPEQREVVALGSAARKHHFIRTASDKPGQAVP